MPSPEAHQKQPLSPEQRRAWRALIEKMALRSLRMLEAFYLSEQEQEDRKDASLTNERYQQWLSWMEKMDADPKALFRQHIFVDEGMLVESTKTFIQVMEALEELRSTQRLSEAMKKKLGIELREDEYLVSVDYGPLPSRQELSQVFLGGVAELFDGCSFVKHPSCEGMDETNGPRIMKLFKFDTRIRSEGAIACAGEEGYRPATEKELLAFIQANSAMREQLVIACLGAFDMSGSSRYIPYAGWRDGRRTLAFYWFGGGWIAGDYLLFVRK